MALDLTIPTPALYILDQLYQAGYEAYIVGGAVRDMHLDSKQERTSLADRKLDFDFTTNATPEQILSVFPAGFYENTFGTVSITHQEVLEQLPNMAPEPPMPSTPQNRLIDLSRVTKAHESLELPDQPEKPDVVHHPNYEITTFRSDGAYHDGRRPSAVTWGTNLEEDLQRRDFTINAMALKIHQDWVKTVLANAEQLPYWQTLPETAFEVIDIFNSQEDLHEHIITTVGDPNQRFQEDALRMLRAVRFSVQLNFAISDATRQALIDNASLLEKISPERVRDELLKILASSYPAEGIELLDEVGLLTFIIPELLEGKGVTQGGHHTTDVWTHSIDALRECPSPDPIVRFATLLHDIAKPQTRGVTNDTITFYNHEIVGSRVAKKIAQRLAFSKKDAQRIFTLVRYHMFHYQPQDTDAAIRRFMRKVGLEYIDDILDLREGDRLGSGAKKTSWRLEEMKQRMLEQLHQPMGLEDLAINGSDLMEELGLKPSPTLGTILHHLLEHVHEEPNDNTREILLKKAKFFLETQER